MGTQGSRSVISPTAPAVKSARDGWYDGIWADLGAVANQNWIHWDSPEGMHAARPAINSVRLRLIVVDGLGWVGSQELNLAGPPEKGRRYRRRRSVVGVRALTQRTPPGRSPRPRRNC